MGVSNDIARLELEAYTAVLRAMAATPMDWNKEKLLTDLRRELHINDSQHCVVLTAVMEDPEITAIRNGVSRPEPRHVIEAHPAASIQKGGPRPTGSSAVQPSGHRKPGRPPVRHSPPTASKSKAGRGKFKGSVVGGDIADNACAATATQHPPRQSVSKLGKGSMRKDSWVSHHEPSPFQGYSGPGAPVQTAIPSYALFPHKASWFASKMSSTRADELIALRDVLATREQYIQEEIALIDAIEEAHLNPLERTERELQHIQFCERLIREELAAMDTE